MTIRQSLYKVFIAAKAKFSSKHSEEKNNIHNQNNSDISPSDEITIASLRNEHPIPGRTISYEPVHGLYDTDKIEALCGSNNSKTSGKVLGRSAALSPAPPKR